MNRTALYLLLFFSSGIQAQVNHEVKIMSWNLLNWPNASSTTSDSATRCPAYRTVVNYVQPDIVVTQENAASNSVPWFLNQVMNTGVYQYSAGLFINGFDTDNAIFYRDSLFDFISNIPIQTSIRDINEFMLVFKPTGDTLRIYSLHLKASQGYEQQRASEITALRQVTNLLPEGSNFLVAGDFNIYASMEPAYTALLQDNPTDDGNVIDPLNMVGTWNNQIYAPYHTQSTHVSSGGGFVGGGMNDRFDMILYSNGVKNPTGVYYLAGTYQNIGNDGNHFDRSINWGTNTAVPSNVANALYNASDHIPVVMNLLIGPTAGIEDLTSEVQFVDVFPNPVSHNASVRFSGKKPLKVGYFISDNLGRVLVESPAVMYGEGEQLISIEGISQLKSGYYLLSLLFDNELINKRIIIFK